MSQRTVRCRDRVIKGLNTNSPAEGDSVEGHTAVDLGAVPEGLNVGGVDADRALQGAHPHPVTSCRGQQNREHTHGNSFINSCYSIHYRVTNRGNVYGNVYFTFCVSVSLFKYQIHIVADMAAARGSLQVSLPFGQGPSHFLQC